MASGRELSLLDPWHLEARISEYPRTLAQTWAEGILLGGTQEARGVGCPQLLWSNGELWLPAGPGRWYRALITVCLASLASVSYEHGTGMGQGLKGHVCINLKIPDETSKN